MIENEDHIALAAEYVLGTLDGDERLQVETMMNVDQDFKALVESWERRLGELHAMVASVEPPEAIWGKIRGAVTAIAPSAAIRLPELSSPPPLVPATPAQPIVPASADVITLTSRARRWRAIAQGVTALAACLVALIGVQAYRPDMLPEQMRPKAQAAAPIRPLVAVLSRDGGPPAFVMTVDVASKTFTVRRAGVDPEGNKSYELWMVSDKFTQPRSLGVIGKTDFTPKAQLASYDRDTVDNATYAITLEPQGGSPTGQPTSAPIFAGKLIEILPQAQQNAR
jgi:anti-sigma-K factor RskA